MSKPAESMAASSVTRARRSVRRGGDELARHLQRRREALVAALPQGARDERAQRRQRRVHPLDGLWLGAEHGGEARVLGRRWERRAAREHLVEHDARGPEVGARVHVAWRCGPGRGSCTRGFPRSIPVRVREPMPPAASITLAMPKSSTLTMKVPSGPRVRNTLSGLRSRWMTPWACAEASPARIPWRIGTACATGMRPPFCRYAPRRHPLEQLHHQVGRAVLGRGALEHARDVRVDEPRAEAALFEKAREHRGVTQELGPQQLDGDALPAIDRLGRVDLAHPAVAELLQKAPLAREHRAGEGACGGGAWAAAVDIRGRTYRTSGPSCAPKRRWTSVTTAAWR